METFITPKELVENPLYEVQRIESFTGLSDAIIDEPIVQIIHGLNALPCCFTLQSCYGHFLYKGQQDRHNLDPLPHTDAISRVEYRIAYIAFCIENSASGKSLFNALKEIPAIDPDNVQFGSADWFWERQVNSYALQVEPDRFKYEDKALLGYDEALHIEKIRNAFFSRLERLLTSCIK